MERNLRMHNPGRVSRVAHFIAALGLTLLAALLVFLFAVRDWETRWGATGAEDSQTLPGDALVLNPQTQTTRAITIDASAAAIWPWIAQMGQGRGGLYSYEMLENLIGCDMHNANSVVADWQHINIGDRVRMYPEGSGPPPYTIAAITPGQALVTGHSTDPKGVPAEVSPQTQWTDTWAFVLQPINDHSTRLIIRSRATYTDPAMRSIMAVLEPGYFIMERGMLFGIKEHAERAAGLQTGITSGDAWGAAFLAVALLTLLAYLFVGRWPLRLALAPLGAVLWLATLFFLYPYAPLAGVLALAFAAALSAQFLLPRNVQHLASNPAPAAT